MLNKMAINLYDGCSKLASKSLREKTCAVTNKECLIARASSFAYTFLRCGSIVFYIKFNAKNHVIAKSIDAKL